MRTLWIQRAEDLAFTLMVVLMVLGAVAAAAIGVYVLAVMVRAYR